MHLAPTSDGGTRTINHTVHKGESLASVARRYHVSLASLQAANGKLKQLKPGQTIIVVQAVARKHSRGRSHKLARRGTSKRLASNRKQRNLHVADSRSR
jgi:LysM repeat protein